MTPQKLSLQDQAAINLCGWIACQLMENPNMDIILANLGRILPAVTNTNPMMARLSLSATAVIIAAPARRGDSMPWCMARLDLAAALSPVFFLRAALACDALWPDHDPTPAPELADAAE